MKDIALYCRVSLSNGTQTTENRKIKLVLYAERNGYTYDLFEGQESTRKTRPVKQGCWQNFGQVNIMQ